MAVNIQAISVATAGTTVRASVAHSVAGGNRFLLVHVGYTAGGTVVSAAADGTVMTKQVCAVSTPSKAAIFTLANVSAGLIPIVFEFQATASSVAIGIISFTSVEQTTPIGTISTEASAGAVDASANVSAAPGDLAFGLIHVGDGLVSALQGTLEYQGLIATAAQTSNLLGLSQLGDMGLRHFRVAGIGAGLTYVMYGTQIRAFRSSAGAAGPYGPTGGRGPTGGQAGVTDPMTSVGDENVGGESRVD